MIILQLSGGLGNQMFQYAFGRYLASKHNTDLVLDLSYVQSKLPFKKWTTPMQYELSIFNNIQATVQANIFSSNYLYPLAKIEHLLKTKYYTKKYNAFQEKDLKFQSDLLSIPNDAFVRGNFQSEKYFMRIENNVRQDFQFLPITDTQNVEHLTNIKSADSVSIHIRRGDYVSIKQNAQKFLALDINYYQNAINTIAEKIPNPTFFIFSDDMNWVEQNLKINYKKYYIKNNNTKNTSYIDMQLMSQCKHNIIANSTFSWWAAWLNPNPNKIVIAPQRWFQHTQVEDLLPNTWLQL